MNERARVLLPLAAAGLCLLVLAIEGSAAPAGLFIGLIAAAVVCIVAAALGLEFSLLRPIAELARSISSSTPVDAALPAPTHAHQLPAVAENVHRLSESLERCKVELGNELRLRKEIGEALRQTRDRYVLAVERANDGIWECDVASGRIEFSPRWKGMQGYLDGGPGDLQSWGALLHSDDRESVLMRLHNHLDGLTPYFDAEYRLRHGDGGYRWVHSRGTALRHASSKPYRLIVMDNDIHARRQLEETLIQAAEGLSSVSREEFFRTLMRQLSAILGTRDNLVCHCVGDPPTRAQTLAYYSAGKFAENFDYELEGSSCGAVIAKKEIEYCQTGVCDIWPMEKKYNRDSYLGVPMFDSNGKIIGHFACMDGDPMRQDLPHLAIFKIFSVRAAAELERTLLKQKLGVL
jgi:PAS domain S-box-containing protein